VLFYNLTDTADEGGWIELRAYNLVGTICENCDAPVANESDKLARLRGLDLGAHLFRERNTALAFNVDQNEVIWASPKQGQPLSVAEGGIDLEARELKDTISKWTQHLTAADVQDCVFLLC
jgi:hypothetical protein